MSWQARITILAAVGALFGGCAKKTRLVVDDRGSEEGGSDAGREPLACLSFIRASCAKSGCHEGQASGYAMDLSTGESIYSAWVNHDGLDNCHGHLMPRIVPGKPDESLVYRKVTSQLDCVGASSQPMPPPPEPPLSPAEIGLLRAWINAGAPKYCTADDFGSNGGASNEPTATNGGAGAGGGSGTGSGADAGAATSDPSGGTGATSSDDLFKCTVSSPCMDQLICHADNCSIPVWDCITHRPPLEEAEMAALPGYAPHHPCPTETMEFCGCDDVTFVSPVTCPDRPYQHVGGCDDGYNCNAYGNVCEKPAPTCVTGETPSIQHACFADCVPAASCRCEFKWECPTGWQCDRTQWRCVPETTGQGM